MLVVKKDTSYRCIVSCSELFIEGKIYEASLEGCKRYTITSESGNSTAWYVLNSSPTCSQFEKVKEDKMRKEFILGKKYMCTIGGVSFTKGEVYDTEQRKGQDFVNLVQPKPVANDFSGYSWWCFNSHAFEEVEDDNTIKVGDFITAFGSTLKRKVLHVTKDQSETYVLFAYKDDKPILKSISEVTKVKDIRTIECAGGAVRVIGEYVGPYGSQGHIQIKIKEHFPYSELHWGTEVPTTPSQPH